MNINHARCWRPPFCTWPTSYASWSATVIFYQVSAALNRSLFDAKLKKAEIAPLWAKLTAKQYHWLECRHLQNKQLVASWLASVPVLSLSGRSHVDENLYYKLSKRPNALKFLQLVYKHPRINHIAQMMSENWVSWPIYLSIDTSTPSLRGSPKRL